ncbi:30S ribosomal protein S31 [Stylosanthes scabra]|uniref:30S ribosomal protein S31 n=1 Tax=Stylosanthes scabra TaxID=79078 RepID=A0ABU6Q9E4_9FABA|nr:30S ribosomal protein S31 [Stylosanthes scabra]
MVNTSTALPVFKTGESKYGYAESKSEFKFHIQQLIDWPAGSSQQAAASYIVYCGRGDRKTAKGKRFAHSFGNARPRDKKKGRGPPKPPVPPGPPKKDRFSEED